MTPEIYNRVGVFSDLRGGGALSVLAPFRIFESTDVYVISFNFFLVLFRVSGNCCGVQLLCDDVGVISITSLGFPLFE